jgi:hypothetical protein
MWSETWRSTSCGYLTEATTPYAFNQWSANQYICSEQLLLFASFGMGEAVYRLLFSEFDGATDRIPVEVLFGLVFALLATKFGGGLYRNRKEISSREPCTSNPQLLVDEAKLSEPDLQVSYFEQLFGIATCDTTVTAW